MMRVAPAEQGAALLTVLLLVAVMAAVSVVALEKLRLSTHLAANGQALDQVRAYAIGAETLAALRVGELSGQETGVTTLAGGWNGRRFPIAVPGGIMTATLRDGGNCFNLNSVVEGDELDKLVARPSGIAQFIALMSILGIGEADARRVAASLTDWIDGDSIPIPQGAEDGDYSRGETRYLNANTLLSEVSELRAVAGVTPEIYATLRPWVCALPAAALSPLNVNTLLPEQAPLLAMLIPDQLDLPRARQILAQRPAEGWESLDLFWQLPALDALVPPMEVQGQPELRTRWFTLDLDVELGGAQVRETALIDGGLSPARIVLRRWGDDE
jgi:general secretion pathway protein K